MTSLHNKVVVVTGAGGGIGSAVCTAFAKAGANVVLVYRSSEDDTRQLLQSLPDENQRHTMIRAAVDDSEQMTALAEQVRATYGRCNVLVNNAGMTRFVAHDNLDGLDDDLIDQIFRVNWRGAFAGVRAFKALLMESAREGSPSVVLNMSSIAGTTGEGSNVAYCASKAALDSMTRSLARALAPQVRVVSIAPGLVDGDYARNLDPDWFDAQAQATPLKRLAQADDVAAACVAVATHLTFTTGNIIHVDGGRPLA